MPQSEIDHFLKIGNLLGLVGFHEKVEDTIKMNTTGNNSSGLSNTDYNMTKYREYQTQDNLPRLKINETIINIDSQPAHIQNRTSNTIVE